MYSENRLRTRPIVTIAPILVVALCGWPALTQAWTIVSVRAGERGNPQGEGTRLIWEWQVRADQDQGEVCDFHVCVGESEDTVEDISGLIEIDNDLRPPGWQSSISKVGNRVYLNWWAPGSVDCIRPPDQGDPENPGTAPRNRRFAVHAERDDFRRGSVEFIATNDRNADPTNGTLGDPRGRIPRGPLLTVSGVGCDLPDRGCTFTTVDFCELLGGTVAQDGCDTGACCVGVCVEASEYDCDGPGLVFGGTDTTCDDYECPEFTVIPTVSTWGALVLALLLVTGAKLRFGSTSRKRVPA